MCSSDLITTIIKSKSGDDITKTELMKLVSEDYLTTSSLVTNSYLGNNLSSENDMLNIVRILAFKALAEVILTTGSTNYAPITNFAQAYPKIIKRIKENHPEYFMKDDMIISICEKTPEAVELCNEKLAKIDLYKEKAEKYVKDAKELEATNKAKVTENDSAQEEATKALESLSNNVKAAEGTLIQINGLASTAKTSAFKGNKKELDTILAQMIIASGIAEASSEQQIKAI